jgi:hypothetical protein
MGTKHKRSREQQANYRMKVVIQNYRTAVILWPHVPALNTVLLETVLDDSHVFTWRVSKLFALRVNRLKFLSDTVPSGTQVGDSTFSFSPWN